MDRQFPTDLPGELVGRFRVDPDIDVDRVGLDKFRKSVNVAVILRAEGGPFPYLKRTGTGRCQF